jgi:hypothetical protein
MKATVRSYIIIFLTCSFMQSFGQILINVDSITIGNYFFPDINEYIIEDAQDGPVIVFYCSFHNNSNTIINLKPDNSIISVEFEVDNIKYSNKIYPFRLYETDLLTIKPNQSVHFTAADAIFLGTTILDKNKTDYLADLVKVVPSLKIVYYEKDVIRIESKCINKVILK